jgi:CheY-like chemotaxis protein
VTEAVEASLQAARHGAQLTKRLLPFSRREPAEALATNINEVIVGMQDIISVTLPQKITYEFRPGTGIWPTRIDPGELEDALLNMVINARDAMPDGGILVVETENQTLDEDYARRNPNLTPGDYATMSVSDTGTGISKEDLEHIFDPFFSTKPADEGSGLGLSMVYGFVTRADGDIKVYSEPGYGTTFRLLLPRAAEDIPETERIPEQLPRGTETILVVDDEAAMREGATSTLSRLGYQTRAAEDAAQALTILKEETDVDLLFSDVVLPGDMLGFGLARTALKQRSDLKVLLTSGFTGQIEQGTDTEALALLQNFLKKPYSTHDLAHHVRAVLDETSSSS